MASKKRGLGIGLDNLIPDIGLDEPKGKKTGKEDVSRETLLPLIKIYQIGRSQELILMRMRYRSLQILSNSMESLNRL